MRRIYDQYVIEYVPRGHTGPKPNAWVRLTRDKTYGLYMSRIGDISNHLSGFDDVQELITILTTQYGLPIKRARDFVNKNVTKEFREVDYRGKLAVVARANRGLQRFTE